MGWISNSRRYETKRWWCGICRQRTPTEVNTDWINAGMPHKWEGEKTWDWFTRCSYCHTTQYDSGFSCDRCGTPSESPEGPIGAECLACGNMDIEYSEISCIECGAPKTLFNIINYMGTCIEMTKPQYNAYYSFEFGVTGYDWEELHQCPKCRHKYWLTNSSC